MSKASEEELDEAYQRGLRQGRNEAKFGPLLPELPAFAPLMRGVRFEPLRSWFDSLAAFERGVTENLRDVERARWTLQRERAALAGEIDATGANRGRGAWVRVGPLASPRRRLSRLPAELADCEQRIALAERAQRLISIQLRAAQNAVDAELEYGRGYACTVEAMRSAPMRPRSVHELPSVEAFVRGDPRRAHRRPDGGLSAGGEDYGYEWRLENPLRRWLTTRWRVSWLSLADREDQTPTYEVYAIEFPGRDLSEETGRIWLMGKIESRDTIRAILPELEERAQRERNSLVVVARRVRDDARREQLERERSTADPLDWLAAIGVLALFAFALIWLATALGLAAKSVETASNTPMFLTLLPLLGSGFVPATTMPDGLRQFATYQPFTPVTETLRGLLTGTHIGTHAIVAIAWSVGIAAISYLWAIRLYQQRQPT